MACTRILLSPEGMSCGGGQEKRACSLPESALACLRTWHEDRPAESWPDLRVASEVEGPGWTTGQAGGGAFGHPGTREYSGSPRLQKPGKAPPCPLWASTSPAKKVREKHPKVDGRWIQKYLVLSSQGFQSSDPKSFIQCRFTKHSLRI